MNHVGVGRFFVTAKARSAWARALAWIAIAWLSAPVSGWAQSVTMYERVRLNLSSTATTGGAAYIGSNPSAVAWDGTKLYVGGYNASGSQQNTAIVQVQGPTVQPGVVTPTFSAVFGQRPTNASQGYSGVAVKGGLVVGAWDNGSATTNPITGFDAANGNASLWDTGSGSNFNQRGMGGVAFDPGHNADPAAGGGVAWLTIGQGRRLMQDATNGQTVYTVTNGSPGTPGMIINTATGGSTWRDVDFDPDNGNLYARRSNDVTFAIRSGSNSVSSTGWIVNNSANGTTVAGQNLAFMNNVTDPGGAYAGDAIIYNDRTATSAGQVFGTVVKMVSVTTGSTAASLGANWNFLYGNAFGTGNGYYDFTFDPATQTLAVLDFANRNVSIFDLNVNVQTVASGSQTPATPLAGTTPLAKRGAGTLVIDQAGAAASGTIYVEQGTLQIGSGGTTGQAGSPLAVTVSSGATLAFDRTDDYGGSFGNVIGGAGGVVVRGGTLVVTATNTYSGGTVISGGTLSIGDGGTTGFVSGNITNDSALVFNRSNATTYSGSISGTGSVTKLGAGDVTFSGSNAHTGPTTVSAGTLTVSNADAVAASNVTVAAGATLAVAAGTTMKAPSVTVNGGTLTAGTVAVNAATGIQTLTVNSGTVANSAAVVVGPGGLVDLPDAARVTIGVTSLTVDQATGGGKIDLGAGEVRVAAGGITAADLRADIIAGLSGGSWNGATGITSGAAAASGGTRAVGYVVDGAGVARVSFAAPGDTTLDGQVDLLDLLEILGSGTYEAGIPAVWSQGDFNYDGITDLLDLLAILGSGTYDQGSYLPSAPVAPSINPVPEPAIAGWIGLAAAAGGLAVRRRGRGLGACRVRPS